MLLKGKTPQKQWRFIMGEFDYKGFMRDFLIADRFGINAIKDTFNRAHKEWQNNVDYYGSFIMTLNHLIWYHYEQNNQERAMLYDELWRKADDFAVNHFKGEELQKLLDFLD